MHRSALVTGASSGIGLSTVLRLPHAGFDALGLVADDAAASRLRAAAERSLGVSVVVADLADPDARAGLVEEIRPWALVNNGGYMNAGQVQDVTLEEARRQLEVMVIAPVDPARQALPAMVRAGQGRIVNITSSAVHTSTPLTTGHPPRHRRVGPGTALLRALDRVVPDRVWDLTVATLARTG